MNPAPPTRSATPLGAYIKAKREAADLSQAELGQKVKTTQGGISNWEAGGVVPSGKFLAALARELPGADIAEMLNLLEDGE